MPLRSPGRKDYSREREWVQEAGRITEPKDRLLELIRNIAKLECQIEQKKVELASQPRFNIYETFRFFDKEGRGVIYLADLRRGLIALSLELS